MNQGPEFPGILSHSLDPWICGQIAGQSRESLDSWQLCYTGTYFTVRPIPTTLRGIVIQ